MRTRFVFNVWIRDPDGPMLPRPPPDGERTPNGLIWGDDIDDFYWVKRIPTVPQLMTIWSRTMLDEFGENFMRANGDADSATRPPRKLQPWPLLRANGVQADPELFWMRLYSPEEGLVAVVDEPDIEPGSSDPEEENTRAEKQMKNVIDQELCEKMSTPDTAAPGTRYLDGASFTLAQTPPEPEAAVKGAQDVDATLTPNVSASAVKEPEEYNEAHDVDSREERNDDSDRRLIGEVANSDGEGEDTDSEDQEGKPAPEVKAKVHVPTDAFAGIPKLEEFIPEAHYPDILLVHDDQDLTFGEHDRKRNSSLTDGPKRYKRVFPVLDGDAASSENPRVAHITLEPHSLLGVGNHSYVYRAPLTLPPPLTARTPSGKVTVAAKLAMPRASARALLTNEARIYDTMPRHFQEDWSGFNLVSPIKYPVPVGAVAPKFFGWYLPEDDNAHENTKSASEDDEGEERCSGRSPILLLEECGEPIRPHKFTLDER